MTRKKVDWDLIMESVLEDGNIPAVLEIDRERGVLYVHDATKGITALRICGLSTGARRVDLWKGTGPTLPIDIAINDKDVVTYGQQLLPFTEGV